MRKEHDLVRFQHAGPGAICWPQKRGVVFRATKTFRVLDSLRWPVRLLGSCALVLASGCRPARVPINVIPGRATLGTAVVRCESVHKFAAGGTTLVSLHLLLDADCPTTPGVWLEVNAMEGGKKRVLVPSLLNPEMTLEPKPMKPLDTPWFMKPAPNTVVEIVVDATCAKESAQGVTSCVLP